MSENSNFKVFTGVNKNGKQCPFGLVFYVQVVIVWPSIDCHWNSMILSMFPINMLDKCSIFVTFTKKIITK